MKNKYMKIQTFEEFLQDKFNDIDEIGGVPITKDNYESANESWFERLDVSELIEYGEEYGKYVEYETTSNIQDKLCIKTLKLHDELKNFNKK